MKNQTPTWVIITAILMMLVGGCGIKNDMQAINIREMINLKDKIVDKIIKAEDGEEQDSNQVVADTMMADSNEQIIVNQDTTETALQDSLSASADSSTVSAQNTDMDDLMGQIFDLPEETIQLYIKFGYAGLFFSLLYLIGGLFLLIKKSFSIKLAYIAILANILFSITKWILMSGKGGTFLSISNSVSSVFSILISIILLVIIIASDKSHFEEQFTD
jgi:hypothetical protein